MIAKGTAHNNGAKLGRYMIEAGEDNERAELYQLRGFAEDDIVSAFRTIQGIAAGTRCAQPFFHCQVRTPAGENLTRKQWELVADRIERKLGLTGQPRAIAFHLKEGHEHMHVAWSRIDQDALTARPLPFFKLRLKEVCRELEVELGLTRVRNEREPGELKPPTRDEYEQAARLGVDPKATRAEIREAWDRSDSGQAFVAALAEKGMRLARGEKRDFVVIDREGGLHALGKRLLGVTAADTRKRIGDLDRDALPTVDQARQQQQTRVRGRSLSGGARKQGRGKKRAVSIDQRMESWQRRVKAERTRAEPSPTSAALTVLDGVSGIALKLTDFVTDLLTGGGAPSNNRKASQVDRMMERRRATAALDQLRDRMERGESLGAADVRSLTHAQLLILQTRGDDGLRRLIEDMQRERSRER
jgi:hypothetical protein